MTTLREELAVRDRGREPLIHSHITDVLPEAHPLAHEQVGCAECGLLVHAFNNECMQTWVETGIGPLCLRCFVKVGGRSVLHDRIALPALSQTDGGGG